MAQQQQTSTKPTMQHKNVAGGMLSLFQKGLGPNGDGYCFDPQPIAATKPSSNEKTCISAKDFQSAISSLSEGQVPRVHLHASHDKALESVGYKDLKKYAAEPEAVSQQNRQESHINPSSGSGAVKERNEFGGDQGTTAPGRGKSHSTTTDPANTTGQRG